MPDLAVIMSIYHRDRLSFVKESVESILQQTYSDFHYYITFDGPVKPEVNEYISSLKDERIRLFRLDQNRGLAVALNYMLAIILKNPEYKYIARMDADDVSMRERFEKQRDFLISNPETTVLGCWYEEIDENGKNIRFRKLPLDHDSLRKYYYTRTPFAHSSVMFDKRLIEIAGYYPEDTFLMEDLVLWRNALIGKLRFSNIPDCLLKFRIDNSFYSRRSGLKYGFFYFLRRVRINSEVSAPILTYVIVLLITIIKISPPFISKFIMKMACEMSQIKQTDAGVKK